MCHILSGSEAGSYLRLIDFVYHSALGLRVIKKNLEAVALLGLGLDGSEYGTHKTVKARLWP